MTGFWNLAGTTAVSREYLWGSWHCGNTIILVHDDINPERQAFGLHHSSLRCHHEDQKELSPLEDTTPACEQKQAGSRVYWPLRTDVRVYSIACPNVCSRPEFFHLLKRSKSVQLGVEVKTVSSVPYGLSEVGINLTQFCFFLMYTKFKQYFELFP